MQNTSSTVIKKPGLREKCHRSDRSALDVGAKNASVMNFGSWILMFMYLLSDKIVDLGAFPNTVDSVSDYFAPNSKALQVKPCSSRCCTTQCPQQSSLQRPHTCLSQTCDSAGLTHPLHMCLKLHTKNTHTEENSIPPHTVLKIRTYQKQTYNTMNTNGQIVHKHI